MTFTYEDVLGDSKNAPDGSDEDQHTSMTTTSEDSFEIMKAEDLVLKTTSSDVSSDIESD
jgi:hypothetical protein